MERHIPRAAGEEAEFFNVTLRVSDYYTPIGEHEADNSIGESNLRKMNRKEKEQVISEAIQRLVKNKGLDLKINRM